MDVSRGRGLVRALTVVGGLGSLLWWATGSPRSVLLALSRNPAARFDDLLTTVAGAIAWSCLCWFAVVVTLQLFALGSGTLARASRRMASRVAPQLMLRGARWLIGVTLLVGPLTSGVAVATPPGAPSAPAPPSAATSLSLDRPAPLDLDRPIAPATAGIALTPVTPAISSNGPSVPAPAPPAPLSPAASPSSPPASTTRPVTSAANPTATAPILTGRAHRNPETSAGYVVQRGDTLWDIAARHLGPHPTAAEIAQAWPQWYAANRVAIGPNPQLIHPGLVLHAPAN